MPSQKCTEVPFVFTHSTCFVVGEPWIDSAHDPVRIAVVLSTENLLLNGWRALQECGSELRVLQLCVDTTWRLVIEGHGTILIGVMAPDQHAHVVGYGVVSQEDTTGHVHCLRELKKGVEAVVAKYTANGHTI